MAAPHDHLLHRLIPMEPVTGLRGRLLSWWSALSTPLVLCALAAVVSPVFGTSATLVSMYSVILLMSIEGLLPRQQLLAVPLLTAAPVVLVVNVREALRR